MLFSKTNGPVDLRNYVNWWVWAAGSSWCQPGGGNVYDLGD
jgi:hypothetical protein